MIHNRAGEKDRAVLPAIAMFQQAPAWSRIARAPSDVTLLAQANELRSNPKHAAQEDPQDETDNSCNATLYPLAAVAIGLPRPNHSTHNLVALLCLFLLIVFGLVWTSGSSLPPPSPETKPSLLVVVPVQTAMPMKSMSTIQSSQTVTILPTFPFEKSDINSSWSTYADIPCEDSLVIRSAHTNRSERIASTTSLNLGKHFAATISIRRNVWIRRSRRVLMQVVDAIWKWITVFEMK
jgi:hypothetical protein